MATKTHNLDACAAVIGALRLSGWGQGGAIAFEAVDPEFQATVGTDGEVTRWKKGNPLVKVTLTVGQKSTANVILSGVHLADKAAPGGILVPFSFIDTIGSSVVVGAEAWVEGMPKAEYTNEPKDREWVVWINADVVFIGN